MWACKVRAPRYEYQDLLTLRLWSSSFLGSGRHESEGGGAINTQMHNVGTGHLIQSGSAGMFTRVDLDLAVSAETTGGGRATLKVFRFRRRKRWRAQRWL